MYICSSRYNYIGTVSSVQYLIQYDSRTAAAFRLGVGRGAGGVSSTDSSHPHPKIIDQLIEGRERKEVLYIYYVHK